MAMRFAGLEISDDAVRCLQYEPTIHGEVIGKYDEVKMPEGVMEGGDMKNEEVLKTLLKTFVQKNSLGYVNVSVPEEKAYLFQTDVVGQNIKDIAGNIEFKLEENVPLAARDAVFYFDLMPLDVSGGVLRASVSVVPRTYVEKQIDLLGNVGLSPIAFEVAPKSIARAAMKNIPGKTSMVVHIMENKIGIYIVSGGVVCFTSTFDVSNDEALSKEIDHTYEYWLSRSGIHVNEIVLAGRKGLEYESGLASRLSFQNCPVTIANTWLNAFELESYVPKMSKLESLDYIVVAGLALDS